MQGVILSRYLNWVYLEKIVIVQMRTRRLKFLQKLIYLTHFSLLLHWYTLWKHQEYQMLSEDIVNATLSGNGLGYFVL